MVPENWRPRRKEGEKEKHTRIIKETTNPSSRNANCMRFKVQNLAKNSSLPKQSRIHPCTLAVQSRLKMSHHTKAEAAITSNVLHERNLVFQLQFSKNWIVSGHSHQILVFQLQIEKINTQKWLKPQNCSQVIEIHICLLVIPETNYWSPLNRW